MSTQQDIYAAGSETRPPMLNKENYVPWSSRLLRYAKSKPNGKLIYNSIMNGPYVRRIIPKPGDPDHKVLVNETFHEQIDEELSEKELKQVAQPGMNMGQNRPMQMVGGNGGNQFKQYAGQNVRNQNGYNAVQNNRNQVVKKCNSEIRHWAEVIANGNNDNLIRCYNYRGVGHLARNCTVKPRRRDVAYLQTQLLIAQKEEA
ncbi:hypothetical protein Tco_0098063 [Tanacetum coccineum]